MRACAHTYVPNQEIKKGWYLGQAAVAVGYELGLVTQRLNDLPGREVDDNRRHGVIIAGSAVDMTTPRIWYRMDYHS